MLNFIDYIIENQFTSYEMSNKDIEFTNSIFRKYSQELIDDINVYFGDSQPNKFGYVLDNRDLTIIYDGIHLATVRLDGDGFSIWYECKYR